MAGADPWDDFTWTPPPPEEETPDGIARGVKRRFAMMEAMDIAASDYDVPIPEDTSPPLAPEGSVKPPKDLAEAGEWVESGRTHLAEAKRQLEQFISDTRSIAPTTEEAARVIKERASIIAKARRDLAQQEQALTDADFNLEQARFTANSNPALMPEFLDKVGQKAGFLKPLLDLVMAPGEMATGLVGTIYDVGHSAGLLPNYASSDVDMTAGDWVTSPLAVFNPDHALRKRGRATAEKVGESFGALGSIAAETGVMRALQDASGYDIEKGLPALTGGAAKLTFELGIDPLNFMELGPITKVGKLRQAARVNAGALETVAVAKAVEDLPAIGKALGDKAFDIAHRGALTTELVQTAKLTPDEAAELSKAFDARLQERLTAYRGMASATPKDWARQTLYELNKLPETDAIKAQKESVGRIDLFGDKIDPINGRSIREQISLGQRGRVLRAIQQKFGDQPWYKHLGDPWAFITGMSLKHDLYDVPEVFAVYTAHRMMKGQLGMEILRFQQDSVEGAAKFLANLEEGQKAQVMEQLPRIRERTSAEGRASMRESIKERYGAHDQAEALLNLADLYETQADTIRAIQNRFGMKVMDLAGEFGYFGRRYSPELQQFIAELPDARAFFFNETSKRSKEALEAALDGSEKSRVLREMDFYEAEEVVRKKMRSLGYPDDKPIWSRDAFGDLARRGEQVQRKAEVRMLYDKFVDAVGSVDAVKMTRATERVAAEVAERQAANAERIAIAESALRDAERMQEGFRAGRKEVRAGYAESAGPATDKPVADTVNQRVRDARKALEEAREAADNANMDKWTVDEKVKWLTTRFKPDAAKGNITGLELLSKANVPLPADMPTLLKLAVTEFSPQQGKQFKKLAEGTIWEHINTPSKLGRVMDAIKVIAQKAQLARPGSLARDLRGTAINGAMAGNTGYLREAYRTVGTFENWRTGGRTSDIVNRLRGEGVLKTTTSEALQRPGTFAKLGAEADSRVGKLLAKGMQRVEERGLVGALLPKRAGEAAAKNLDKLNDARVYWEEVNRVATYLKATREGMSHAEAVEEIYKWWGKFDELTRLERNVLNRIMFFWAWQARSIPISMRHLLTHPVRAKLVLAMTAGNVNDDKDMPDWLKRMGGWVLGRNENGTVDAINVGGTYFDPMISMLQGNFANEVMSGKNFNPLDAAGTLGMDIFRSSPPHIQAIAEAGLKKDLFTNHDWWKDRNAEAVSQAKAPTAFWWLYGDNAISAALGLKAVGKKDGQYLTMDPRWSWFFGAVPGLETTLTDVSAFFSSPLLTEGEAPAPDITPFRGILRQAGFPLYEVPLEKGKEQVYQLKAALVKDADKTAGLTAFNGRVVPAKNFRGQQISADMQRWRDAARLQKMTPTQIDQYVSERLLKHYPQEGRVLALQDKVEAWEKYLIQIDKGIEIEAGLANDLERIARRAETSRISEFELREKREKERKLGLLPR